MITWEHVMAITSEHVRSSPAAGMESDNSFLVGYLSGAVADTLNEVRAMRADGMTIPPLQIELQYAVLLVDNHQKGH